jgi:hypothetical protein
MAARSSTTTPEVLALATFVYVTISSSKTEELLSEPDILLVAPAIVRPAIELISSLRAARKPNIPAI